MIHSGRKIWNRFWEKILEMCLLLRKRVWNLGTHQSGYQYSVVFILISLNLNFAILKHLILVASLLFPSLVFWFFFPVFLYSQFPPSFLTDTMLPTYELLSCWAMHALYWQHPSHFHHMLYVLQFSNISPVLTVAGMLNLYYTLTI